MNRSVVGITAIAVAAGASLMLSAQQRGQGGQRDTGATTAPARGATTPARGTVTRPAARIGSRPNMNGIWQAISTAHWNLEDHPAAATAFWQLGAIGAIPAGQSVIVDNNGMIPYTPAGAKKRDENRAGWPKSDPEANCYLPGLPRATYMPFPFQIIQGQRDILFVYEYANSRRLVHMNNHVEPPVDSWMGWSNGRWDGDTLVIEATGFNDQTWFDRAGNHHSDALKITERYALQGEDRLQYEARIEDPKTFTQPWTIRLPIYRRLEPGVSLLEFNCVEFSEELLYGHLKKPSK
jgi:hypothetical protein